MRVALSPIRGVRRLLLIPSFLYFAGVVTPSPSWLLSKGYSVPYVHDTSLDPYNTPALQRRVNKSKKPLIPEGIPMFRGRG